MSVRTVHKTCNLCEATCGLLIDVADEHVTRIRGDDQDPFSRGHICPKAIGLRQLLEDPDRLRFPMRRLPSGSWERASWDAAFDAVAEGLHRVREEHGPDAVATYLGNPGAHNFGTIFYLSPLYRALKTRNRYSASSLDQNPVHASSQLLFGSTFAIPIPDIDRTDFFLILGANPVVSNGSLMTAPGFSRRLRELNERGGRCIVIDPRRTETARLADEHLFIRPGADAWLLAALVHVVFAEHLGHDSFQDFVVDAQLLERALSRFTPEAVAERVGISAARIRTLAGEFAAAESAVCYGRVGICLNPYGTLNSWLVNVLNLVTGNLDRPGGAMFPTPAIDLVDLTSRIGSDDPDWTTRVRGAPSFNGEQPSACLAEELNTPGSGQIRGLLTVAGNPVLSAPNGAAIDRGLAGLEFFAAVDFYRNETTRHAHWILPPTTSLEHDNYEVLFHGFAVRNTAKYSPVVIPAEPGMRHEWEILTELSLRLLQRGASRKRARWALAVARKSYPLLHPRRLIDWSLRLGPYGDGFRPWRRGLRLSTLEANRKGIDLGPLEPRLEHHVRRGNGHIHLAPDSMLGELDRLAKDLAEPHRDGLTLIGRRDVRTNNSWLHNVPLSAGGRDRCTLLAHPDDARRLGVESGAAVRVTSRVGSVVTTLEISDDLMPGVVSLPHGWGHRGSGMQMRLAEQHPGVSYNDLADDMSIEAVVGNAILNGVPVQLEAAS